MPPGWAGQFPAMVRGAEGDVRVLDESGCPPVGVFGGVEFRKSTATLTSGDGRAGCQRRDDVAVLVRCT